MQIIITNFGPLFFMNRLDEGLMLWGGARPDPSSGKCPFDLEKGDK
ncbi:hypothetical protein [Paenibacillus polymyxa]|nr:hypothetical protein [Paenibacillus polymyxa]MCF2720386.1 hypothetical protein [Paenibacillus sp. UKAQ_18]